ncbi:hypothetical protein [Treponema endosymbiont of Eucomonympha sp.]|uniref:hypothetical protein n=1 Tax=Treponema endosymbiont of Eucomonympha sp. TaxID=1580831 RepID=UPI001650B8AC|nr:hypothetical protein [Treponema endosymbiont of Eucomonympha sp.]
MARHIGGIWASVQRRTGQRRFCRQAAQREGAYIDEDKCNNGGSVALLVETAAKPAW